jgi:hypothetical protein
VLLFSVPFADGDTFRIQIQTVCKELSSSGKATLERVGLFYRSGFQTYAQRFWETTVSTKSAPAFDLSYTLNPSTVDIKVKNAAAVPTKWFGRLITDVV